MKRNTGKSLAQRRRPVARPPSAVCRTRKSQVQLTRTATPKEEMTCPLRPQSLTVKLSGRPEALDQTPLAHTVFSAPAARSRRTFTVPPPTIVRHPGSSISSVPLRFRQRPRRSACASAGFRECLTQWRWSPHCRCPREGGSAYLIVAEACDSVKTREARTPPNGEVEGPPRSATQAPGAHTLLRACGA